MATRRDAITQTLVSLPEQVSLSEVLSRRIMRNSAEAAVASMAEEILLQTQLTNPEEGLALAPSGWHPVRASFEVDKVSLVLFFHSRHARFHPSFVLQGKGGKRWEPLIFLLAKLCPQESITSFAISDDGQLYSALTSSNTCALVDVGVSQGKAAWEFLLEEDSPGYVTYSLL